MPLNNTVPLANNGCCPYGVKCLVDVEEGGPTLAQFIKSVSFWLTQLLAGLDKWFSVDDQFNTTGFWLLEQCRKVFSLSTKALMQWLKLPDWKGANREFKPRSGIQDTKCFFLAHSVKNYIVGSLRHREVACSASDRQRSNFAFRVWRAVPSHSPHHSREVPLAQLSLCMCTKVA